MKFLFNEFKCTVKWFKKYNVTYTDLTDQRAKLKFCNKINQVVQGK